jgi:hypothetical protein
VGRFLCLPYKSSIKISLWDVKEAQGSWGFSFPAWDAVKGQKKKNRPLRSGSFVQPFGRRDSALFDGAGGADAGAGSAIDAGIGVDLVMIAPLRDGADGALALAAAAADALIANHIGHFRYTSLLVYLHFSINGENCN